MTVTGKFMRHVMKDPSTGCWNWMACKSIGGYGIFGFQGKNQQAHRVSWFLKHGSLPPKPLQLDHLCRNRACVNPDHLEPVTCQENLLRGNTLNALNAAKTACINGHAFTPENTARTPKGRRVCRTCVTINAERFRRRRGELPRAELSALLAIQCKRGHAFDSVNTYIDANGWRHCKTCDRLRKRKVQI